MSPEGKNKKQKTEGQVWQQLAEALFKWLGFPAPQKKQMDVSTGVHVSAGTGQVLIFQQVKKNSACSDSTDGIREMQIQLCCDLLHWNTTDWTHKL